MIQAKHTHRRYDGYKGIQEVHSAKPVYESGMQKTFERLVFMTNSPSLANRTYDVAMTCGVEILERATLLNYLEEHEVTFREILTRLAKSRMKV